MVVGVCAWRTARRKATVGRCVVSRRVTIAVETAGCSPSIGTNRTPGVE
jgi:hypothetical protein